MPLHSRTHQFESMLSRPKIQRVLDTHGCRGAVSAIPWRRMVYTEGTSFFDRCHQSVAVNHV